MAVVGEGIEQPVHLYGHSFGGTCAIEAATRVHTLASLILYEGGPKLPGIRFIPDDLIARLETLIRDDQQDEALSLFTLTAGLAPMDLDVLRRSPASAVDWRPTASRAVTSCQPSNEPTCRSSASTTSATPPQR